MKQKMKQDWLPISMIMETILLLCFMAILPVFGEDDFFKDGFPLHSGIVGFDQDKKIQWFYPAPGDPNDVALLANKTELAIVSINGCFEIAGYDGKRRFFEFFPPLDDVDILKDPNEFLLTSRIGKQVIFFNIDTKAKRIFPHTFDGPVDADLLPNGNLLVADAPSSKILEMKPSGDVVWQYDKELKQPMDALRLPNDLTVISDFDNHRLLYVRQDGVIAREIGGFNHPGKLTYQPDTDAILVADKDNQRLVEVNSNGTLKIIRDQLNYIQSAFYFPESKMYFCAVIKRFLPPANEPPPTSATPAVKPQQPAPVLPLFDRIGVAMSNSYLWILISAAVWGLSFITKRHKNISSLLCFSAYIPALAVGFITQTEARALYPYVPAFSFWISAFLLFLYSFRDSSSLLLPMDRHKFAGQNFDFPFSLRRTLFLILYPALPLLLQILQFPKWPSIGTLPWYFVMGAWALGAFVMGLPLLPDNVKKAWKNGNFGLTKTFTGLFPLGWSENKTAEENSNNNSSFWPDTAVFITVFIAVLLYTIKAAHVPTDVHGDEGEVALWGIAARDSGNWNIFTLGWYHIPNLFYLIPAWVMWLFGDTVTGIRVQGAIFGVLSIPVFYGLSRRIIQTPAAALASFIFATSAYFIHFSRMGIGYNQATFFLQVVFYFFIRGVQENQIRWFGWAGFFTAISFLSYQAAKITLPLLLLAFLILWIYRILSWQKIIVSSFVYVLAFWVGISPLLGNFVIDPQAMESRTKSVSIFSQSGRELMRIGNPENITFRELLGLQLQRTLLSPVTNADRSPYLVNSHSGGILDTLPAVSWVAGIFLLLCHLKNPFSLLLLLWTISVMVLGSVITNNAPSYQRLTVLYPFLALQSAAVLYGILTHWSRLLQWSPATRRIVISTLAALLLILSGHRYFYSIQSVPQLLDEWTRIARYLEQVSGTHYVYFLGKPHVTIQYGTTRFIAPNVKGEDVSNPREFLPKKILRRGPVSFVMVRENREYISLLRDLYPGGRQIDYYSSAGTAPFMVYEVNL